MEKSRATNPITTRNTLELRFLVTVNGLKLSDIIVSTELEAWIDGDLEVTSSAFWVGSSKATHF